MLHLTECSKIMFPIAPHKYIFPVDLLEDAIAELGWEEETEDLALGDDKRRFVDRDENSILVVDCYDWYHQINEYMTQLQESECVA